MLILDGVKLLPLGCLQAEIEEEKRSKRRNTHGSNFNETAARLGIFGPAKLVAGTLRWLAHLHARRNGIHVIDCNKYAAKHTTCVMQQQRHVVLFCWY